VNWLEFWEFTSADWAGLQFLALVVAACFAFYEAREARKLRRAQAEPFVVADLEVDDDQQAYIVVSNIGATVAENVRFNFNPEPQSSCGTKSRISCRCVTRRHLSRVSRRFRPVNGFGPSSTCSLRGTVTLFLTSTKSRLPMTLRL
jgi:hypothetical protein